MKMVEDTVEKYLLERAKKCSKPRNRYASNSNIGKRTGKVITSVGGIGDLSQLFRSFDSDSDISDKQHVSATQSPPQQDQTVPASRQKRLRPRPPSPPEFSSSDESREPEHTTVRNGHTESDYVSLSNTRNLADESLKAKDQVAAASKSFVHQGTQHSGPRPPKEGSILILQQQHNMSQSSPTANHSILEVRGNKNIIASPGSMMTVLVNMSQKKAASNDTPSSQESKMKSEKLFQKILSTRKAASESTASESEGLDVEVFDSRKPSPETTNLLSSFVTTKRTRTPNVLQDYTQMISSQMNRAGTTMGSLTKNSTDVPTPKGKQQAQIRRRLMFSEAKRNSLTPSTSKPVIQVHQSPKEVSAVQPVFELDVGYGVSAGEEFVIKETQSSANCRWEYLSAEPTVSSARLLKRRKSRERPVRNSDSRSPSIERQTSSTKRLSSGKKRKAVILSSASEVSDEESPPTSHAFRPSSSKNRNTIVNKVVTPMKTPMGLTNKKTKSQPRRGLDFSRFQNTEKADTAKSNKKASEESVQYLFKDGSKKSAAVSVPKRSPKKRKSTKAPINSLVAYSSSGSSDEDYAPTKALPPGAKKRVMANRNASLHQSYAEEELNMLANSSLSNNSDVERHLTTSKKPKAKRKLIEPEFNDTGKKKNDNKSNASRSLKVSQQPETSGSQDRQTTRTVERTKSSHMSDPPTKTPLPTQTKKNKSKKAKRSKIDLETSSLSSWLKTATSKKFAAPETMTEEYMLRSTKIHERTVLERADPWEKHVETERFVDPLTESHPPLPVVDESAINYSDDRSRIKSRLPAAFGPPASTPRALRKTKREVSPEPPTLTETEAANGIDLAESSSWISTCTRDSYAVPKRRSKRKTTIKSSARRATKSASKASASKSGNRSKKLTDDKRSAADESNAEAAPCNLSWNLRSRSTRAGASSEARLTAGTASESGTNVTSPLVAGTSKNGAESRGRSTRKNRRNVSRTVTALSQNATDSESDKSTDPLGQPHRSAQETPAGHSSDESAGGTLVASDADATDNTLVAATNVSRRSLPSPPEQSRTVNKRGEKVNGGDATSSHADSSPERPTRARASNTTKNKALPHSESARDDTDSTSVTKGRKKKPKKKPPIANGSQRAKKTSFSHWYSDLTNREAPELIIPVPSPEAVAKGLRRSTRVRSRPLQRFYEKLVYEPSSGGFGAIAGFKTYQGVVPLDLTKIDHSTVVSPRKGVVVKVTCMDSGTSQKEKQVTKSKKTKGGRKKKASPKKSTVDRDTSNTTGTVSKAAAGNAAESEASEMLWYDNMEGSNSTIPHVNVTLTRSRINAGDSMRSKSSSVQDTQNTTMRITSSDNTILTVSKSSIFCHVGNESFVGPTKQPAKADDELIISKGIAGGEASQGMLHLRPCKHKQMRTIKTALVCFLVYQGVVEVTVNDTLETVVAGGYFRVPLGNAYALYNPDKNTTAILHYTMLRKKQMTHTASGTNS